MAERTAREPELTPREAIAKFEKAVQERNDAEAHFNLGSAYYVAGDLDAAFREFQQTLSMSSGFDHARYYLGAIYKSLGDKEKARQEFDKILNSSANFMLKNQAKLQLQALDGIKGQ
jgi:tetratricopeptide (TPR) repeat protein